MIARVLAVAAVLLAVAAAPASAGAVSPQAAAALAKLLPTGYRTAAVLPCVLDGTGSRRFVAALVDTESDEPEKVVRLLYLDWKEGWTVLDSIEIAGRDATVAPQFLSGIAVVTVGSAKLLYVYTTWSRGGSGSVNYHQFFDVIGDRLKRVKAFEHERMERGLLCLQNQRIYDASVVCSRGEKRGNAYVYSCYLDAREFTFDGDAVLETRGERLEERTGNRFLGESYRNMSLRSVLERGGHFLPPPTPVQ